MKRCHGFLIASLSVVVFITSRARAFCYVHATRLRASSSHEAPLVPSQGRCAPRPCWSKFSWSLWPRRSIQLASTQDGVPGGGGEVDGPDDFNLGGQAFHVRSVGCEFPQMPFGQPDERRHSAERGAQRCIQPTAKVLIVPPSFFPVS